MNIKGIEVLAEQAEREGDKVLAVILFTYLGAKYAGTESQLASYVARFAQADVDQIHYDKWVETAGNGQSQP